MKDPLGVSPSKGNQGTTRGKEKFLLTSVGKKGRIVRKAVNANPGLNVNQIITFSSFQMFLLLCFAYMVMIETENKRPNNIQKTSAQCY